MLLSYCTKGAKGGKKIHQSNRKSNPTWRDTCFTLVISIAKLSLHCPWLKSFWLCWETAPLLSCCSEEYGLMFTICRLHLSWVQLETPGSCAILMGVRLVPLNYCGETSSTPDGCCTRWSYSALGIILQGLVMSTLPGMKWHTPEFGYTTMYYKWRGRRWNWLGSHLSPYTSTSAAERRGFWMQPMFWVRLLLQFTCQGDFVACVWKYIHSSKVWSLIKVPSWVSTTPTITQSPKTVNGNT